MVFESIFQKGAQLELIKNITLVDQLFIMKSKTVVPYHKEKYEMFVVCFVLVSIVVLTSLFFALHTQTEKSLP